MHILYSPDERIVKKNISFNQWYIPTGIWLNKLY